MQLRCCTSTEAKHSEIGILRFKELSCYWSTPSTEYCAIGNLKGYGIPTVGPGTKSTLSTRSKQCGDAVILSSSTVGLQSLFTKALVQELVWTLSLCKPRTDVVVSSRRNPAFSSYVQNSKVILRSASHAHAPGPPYSTNTWLTLESWNIVCSQDGIFSMPKHFVLSLKFSLKFQFL